MSMENVKNVEAAEEVKDQEETTEDTQMKLEAPKATKLEVAQVFIKRNWKKILIGTGLVVVAGYVASKAKDTIDSDEGLKEVEGTEEDIQ